MKTDREVIQDYVARKELEMLEALKRRSRKERERKEKERRERGY